MKLDIVDIPERAVKYEKRYGIFANGVDNAYPTLVERLINSSPTAKACADVVNKYLTCDGFTFEFNARQSAISSGLRFDKVALSINRKRETPNALLKKVGKTLSRQRGCVFHVNYNALFQKKSIQHLPYKWARLGEDDDEGYNGKMIVYDNWDYSKKRVISKSEFEVFDVYNPNPDVIQSQVEKAGGWKNYKGQIFFLNLDLNDTYPLSWADVALIDCDSERKSSTFTNNGFAKGFFGKYMMFTKPFEKESEREEFRENIKKGVGVESVETVMHFEMDKESEVFKEEYSLEKIESNIDDKTFSYTDGKTARNIRAAFGVPTVLIEEVEGKLGNTSGESFEQAQLYMQRKLGDERMLIEEAFEELFDNFYKPVSPNGLFTIKLLIDEVENNQE